MIKGIKVRLDPTPRQEGLLASNAGAARKAFNIALARYKHQLELGEDANYGAYANRKWFNEWKDELWPWWFQNSKEAYSSGFADFEAAMKNFYDSRAGKRKGPKVGFPKFKSKNDEKASWTYTTGGFGLVKNDPKALKLPKIGRVHCFEDVIRRVGSGKVKAMTISRYAGWWYASLRVEYPDPPVHKRASRKSLRVAGVDLGVKTLAVVSDGSVMENPKHARRAQKKLRKAQRRMSRRVKGSKRYARARRAFQRANARVRFARRADLEAFTSRLVKDYDVICIEDLNVEGMKQNHCLAGAVSDASFGLFRSLLEFKALTHGVEVIVADRWFASSKTCSACGSVKAKLDLSERVYSCEECGVALDRDLNAAFNLEDWAVDCLKRTDAGRTPESLNARGGLVRRASRSLGVGKAARLGEARTRGVSDDALSLTVTPGVGARKGSMQDD